MSLKDIWKDKVDGVDDVRAEDINAIANEAIRLDKDKVDNVAGKGLSTNDFTNEEKEKLAGLEKYNDTELKLRDERLKYYGDPDIVPTDESCFSFRTDEETMTATITYIYSFESGETLVIPYKHNGYLVTDIGKEAGWSNSYVQSIIMPNSITTIGWDAFYGCENLVNVTIPETVTTINSSAFNDCNSLASITIPSSVTSIGSYALTTGNPNLVIICAEGSVGDKYARANGIKVEYNNEVTKEYIDDLKVVKYTEQSLTEEQKAQVRSNIGAGESGFSGSYEDLSNKPTIPVVDSVLSSTSINALQNKIITSELNGKVDKVSGKGLSTNDFTNEEKEKLSEAYNAISIPLWKPNTQYNVGDVVLLPYNDDVFFEGRLLYMKYFYCISAHISGTDFFQYDYKWNELTTYSTMAEGANSIEALDEDTDKYLGYISGQQIYDVVKFIGNLPNESDLNLSELVQAIGQVLDDKFVINITLKDDGNGSIILDTIDKTFDEIKNAYLSNKTMISKLKIPLVLVEDDMGEEITETLYPYLINNNYVYDDTVDTFVFEFSSYIQQGVNRLEHSSPYCIYVNIANGGIKIEEIPIASTTLVDDYIGDIETALDSIIDIQNSLMGVSE